MHTYIHTYIREREIGERVAWGDGEDGERREGERTTEHTRETRERGRRRKGRGQCRRTEPEALKFSMVFPFESAHACIYIYIYIMYHYIYIYIYIIISIYHFPRPPPPPPRLFDRVGAGSRGRWHRSTVEYTRWDAAAALAPLGTP